MAWAAPFYIYYHYILLPEKNISLPNDPHEIPYHLIFTNLSQTINFPYPPINKISIKRLFNFKQLFSFVPSFDISGESSEYGIQ